MTLMTSAVQVDGDQISVPSPDQPYGSGYAPAIDGMKAIGLVVMLAAHSGMTWAKGGIFTISMFFTLSGFLITSLLLTEKRRTGAVGLKQFWVRRFRRLLPAALVLLLFVVVFGFTIADVAQRNALRGDVFAALAYVANWRFIVSGQSYLESFQAPSPVLHFWSLAIEEQFYLLFPLIAIGAMFGRRGRNQSFATARRNLGIVLVILIGASVAAGLRPGLSQDRIYLGTDTRAGELLIGALLAVLLCGRPMGTPTKSLNWRRALHVIGPFAMIASITIWSIVPKTSDWIYHAGFPAYALLTAVFVAAANDSSNIVAKALQGKPLGWLGQRTYGVYLVHFPIFLIITGARTGLSPYPLFGLRVIVSLLIAELSFRYLETPIRAGQPIFGQPLKRLAPVVAVIVVFAVVATTGNLETSTAEAAKANPNAFQKTVGADADTAPVAPTGATILPLAADTRPPGSSLPTNAVGTIVAALANPQPVPGGLAPKPIRAPRRPLRMMIVGDSSAVFLTWTLAEWSPDTPVFDISSKALMGCGLLDGGIEVAGGSEIGFDKKCANWRDDWRRGIADAKPDVILVADAFHDATDRRLTPEGPLEHVGQDHFDQALLKAWGEAADVLAESGKPVLWLNAPPILEGRNLPAFNTASAPANDPARMDDLNELLTRLASSHENIHVVDYTQFFLTWPGGAFDEALRQDGMHVDGPGRAIIGRWLGPELLDAYWTALGQ